MREETRHSIWSENIGIFSIQHIYKASSNQIMFCEATDVVRRIKIIIAIPVIIAIIKILPRNSRVL